jgi:hypothetical protein
MKVKSSLNIIKNAGHNIQYDNPEDLCAFLINNGV